MFMFWQKIPLTAIHYLFHYPFTGFIVLVLLIRSTLGYDHQATSIIGFWASTLFRTLGHRVYTEGLEHLNSQSNRVVVLNHASLFDIPAIMTVLPGGSFIGRSKLLSIPFFGKALKSIGYIPIDSHHISQSMEALNKGIAGISEGRSIIMFPEGTRTLDGELLPFKRGFVRILRKSGADLQPVTLNGFYDLKSKYSKTLGKGEPLSIKIHPPIKAEELQSLNDREIIDKARDIIKSSYLKKRKQYEP